MTDGIGGTGVVGVLENGAGADATLDDGLADVIPRPDVTFAQHVLPYPAGYVGVRWGTFLSVSLPFP